MVTWGARLAKIQLLGSSRGTGWAIGRTGVLTAGAVVAGLIPGGTGKSDSRREDRPPPPVEIVIGAATGRAFTCQLIWYDDAVGLALLDVCGDGRGRWRRLLRDAQEPMLAAPRDEALVGVHVAGFAAGPVRGNDRSSLAWMLAEPVSATGTLTLASRARGRRILEVERHELARDTVRKGIPGSPVLSDDPVPMIVGVVTGRLRPHTRRARLEVGLLPDPARQSALAAALERVGVPAAVYSMDGPVIRRYVTDHCLDRSLRPVTAAVLDDPGWFGTRTARTGGAADGDPYFPFVDRPEHGALVEALDAAVAGIGPRVVVLKGPSASGKSRLAAEVVPRRAALADHQLLTPRRDRPITDLPARLRGTPTLVWLDGLREFSAWALTRPMARELLHANPRLIVLATVVDRPPPAGESSAAPENGDSAGSTESTGPAAALETERDPDDDTDPPDRAPGYGPAAALPAAAASLSGVQSVIDDTALTRVITVPSQPEWQVPPAAPAEVAGTIGEAARAGVGLGEWLSGYPDLADRYTAARWPTRALVDLVVDWDTSGIGVPLPSGVAYSLWEDYAATRLPRDELRRFMRLTDHEIHHEWTEAQAFAEREVTLGAALITVGTEGLMASEFSRVYSARTAVSARIWDHLLHTYPATPEQRLNLGLRALEFGTPQRALRAFESILFYRDEDAAAGRSLLVEITARRGVALYHACLGHDEQAVVAYTDLIDTFGGHDDAEVAEQVAHALLGLGITFGRMGSHGQAASAFGELIGRYGDGKLVGMRVQVAQGLIGQAVTFGQLGRRSDEISAYTEVLDRYERDDSSALAAMCDVARAALDRLHGGRG